GVPVLHKELLQLAVVLHGKPDGPAGHIALGGRAQRLHECAGRTGDQHALALGRSGAGSPPLDHIAVAVYDLQLSAGHVLAGGDVQLGDADAGGRVHHRDGGAVCLVPVGRVDDLSVGRLFGDLQLREEVRGRAAYQVDLVKVETGK